ncbi:MAG: transporter transrane protein [Firmicutes bacterium]|nr:transporter transrane protein [Bacillota bacterium]
MANESVQYPSVRWFVLIAGVLSAFFAMMAGMAAAPLMPVISKDLGVDMGVASFGIMGIMMVGMAISVLIWGFLVDKIGIFKVMISGLVILLIIHLLYPIIGHDYNTVVVMRVLTAFGAAPGLIVIEPIVARWFPIKERGLALGINCLNMVGAIVGLTCGPMFASMAGSWQGGLAWLSVIIAIGIVYMLFVWNLAKNAQTPVTAALEADTAPSENFFKMIVRNPAFWLGLAVMAFSNWANNAFNDLAPGFFAADPPLGVGYGPQMAGQLASGNMFGIMLGIFCGGIIIDKVFKGRSGLLVMIGFAANLILYNGVLADSINSNLSILVPWLLFAGFVNPFTAVGNQYFAVRSFSPKIIGKVAASWTCISNFVGSFGVMAGSYALHSTGNYHASFALVAIICILGFIAALVSRERRTEIEMANGKTQRA